MSMELHRGRLLDHLHLVVADLEASRRFYKAVLGVLGIGPHHAIQAPDRAAVDAVYRVGVASGGRSNGAPGLRPYHADYYAAFLLDPDGNNVEAVHHGPHARSAPSVVIRF